jgi:hypothetical protein
MDIQELAQELADVIMAAREKDIEKSTIKFPIREIDGVICYTWLMPVKEDKGLIFKVDTAIVSHGHDIELYRSYKTSESKLTRTDVLEFCAELLTIIPLLKLSVNGTFKPFETTDEDQKLDKIFEKLSLKTNNIKLCGADCCVCYNKTRTKTDCNHPLCYRCWAKIEDKASDDYNEEDSDDEATCAKCPLCRERIN